MSKKTTAPLSADRWAYLKALRPSAGRMIHTSVAIIKIPLPDGDTVYVPQRPGVSYEPWKSGSVSKAEYRALRKSMRKAGWKELPAQIEATTDDEEVSS